MASGVTGRFFPTFGHHLGQAGNYRTFNEATLNNGGAGPYLGHLGQLVEDNGKVFRLVQYNKGTDSVATIDGGVVYWKDKSNYIVTPDAGTDSEAERNGVAGGTHVAIAAGSSGNYMYVQCGGDQAAVTVAASTVAGDVLTGDPTNDNVLVRTAAGTAPVAVPVAVALSTRGTTTSDSGGSVSNSSKLRWILGNLI